MPCIGRFVRSDLPTIYHVISITALMGFLGGRFKSQIVSELWGGQLLLRWYLTTGYMTFPNP